MQQRPVVNTPVLSSRQWLRSYYATRAGGGIAWIGLALTVGRQTPAAGAVLMVAYPAWDALANYLDARRNGGLRANFSQSLNLAVSLVTAAGVALALGQGAGPALAVFGAWAILSGLLQLLTGLRRWRAQGAQWAMALSGAQSALAGAFFFRMAAAPPPSAVVAVAPYAAFGAFYFLVSALWLTLRRDPAIAVEGVPAK